jgi:phosphatidylglycerol:prolipoprotein diacylglycerol transferase
MVPWIVVLSLLGARLGEVLIFEPGYYLANPGQILAIWNGGLSIMGGIAGGALAVLWYCRRHLLPVPSYLDAAAVALPLGQAIGRWGNYFNQELYGRPTNLPWAISVDPGHRMPGYEQFSTFHPLFLYESLLNLVLFLALWQLSRRSLKQSNMAFLEKIS